MNKQPLFELEKQMLAVRISVCHQKKVLQVLELLLENYPQKSCIETICAQLEINQNNLLHSILRNARIFIEVDTLYTNNKPTHLAIGKQAVHAVRCQYLCNKYSDC